MKAIDETWTVDTYRGCVAQLDGGPRLFGPAPDDAMSLAAAAPELYRALKLIQDTGGVSDHGAPDMAINAMIDAALKKARGEP